MNFREVRLVREEVMRDYLLRRLDPETVEAFESYYLESDQCFEELTATRVLLAGLDRPRLDARRRNDVTVLEFTGPANLVRQSPEMRELSLVFEQMQAPSDTKVLVDLSRVSKIDSSGLGLLMTCYSQAIRNKGMLKLLNPSPVLRDMLRRTRMDTVLETYDSEQEALLSFGQD